MGCLHENFAAQVDVNRIAGKDGAVAGFQADVRIQCAVCGKPFQFLGLKPGLDYRGAAISPDGLEARLGIVPEGEQPSPMELLGFRIKAGQ